MPDLAFQVSNLARRIFYWGQWRLAVAPVIDSEDGLPRGNHFSVIEPPSGFSYADPFLFIHAARTYLFFEIYSRREKGVIAYCELLEDGTHTSPRVVLRASYHLSYPFVFEWDGNIYLLPETQENGTIELYRANDFPNSWNLHAVLMRNIKYFDPTLYFDGRKWWLFAGSQTNPTEEVSELHLFVSESPFGPWKKHPRNPVVVGKHCARPAGRLFRLGQHLLRPGQDSSRLYGEAISLNRVEVLTETDYREVPYLRLGGSALPDSCRTHSIDLNEQYRVQDGLRYVPRFSLKTMLRHASSSPNVVTELQ